MSRPFFHPGLDPTPGELLVFSLWLIVVLATMTAMYLIPAFNLVFWPILWTYDLWTSMKEPEEQSTTSTARPDRHARSKTLWDRELDG